jgi:hypothetical protein
MKRKSDLICAVTTFLVSGCFTRAGTETKTFVISELRVPNAAGEAFAPRDFDGDNTNDNELPGWLQLGSVFGLDLQNQLSEQINLGSYLFGILLTQSVSPREDALLMFRADTIVPLRFDGTDQLLSQQEFLFAQTDFFLDENLREQVRASGTTLEWSLFPFGVGDLLTVPLQDVRVESLILEDLLQGSLTGYIEALDAARFLEQTPAMFDALLLSEAADFGGGAVVPCEGNQAGESQACLELEQNSFCSDGIEDSVVTGVCVSRETISRRALAFLDSNKDGHYTVDFNEDTLLFNENELSLLFTINPNNNIPSGILGQLFNLDSDSNGDFDAMPVGIEFTAVPAIRAR